MRAEFAELSGHDAYDLLGLGPEASEQEIQRAYRTLAKANHPDRFPEPRAKAEAEGTLRLLNAARDVLTGRRADYDDFRYARDAGARDGEIVKDDPRAPARPEPPEPPKPPAQGPPSGAPTLRRRRPRSPGARFGLGCAVVWGGLLVVGVGLSELGDHLRARSGPQPSASVPARFAGTWTGVLGGHGGAHTDGWTAELTLREGAHNGEVRYLGGRCAGTAVPVWAQADRLTVRTVFPEREAECDVGRIQLTMGEGGGLRVRFVKDGTVTGTGSLARR